MPTLLQINTSINIGSTGRIAEQLGQYVQLKGWNSYIAYGRRIRNSKSSPVKIGNKIDISFHVLQSRIFDRHGLGSVRSTREFLNEIMRINPDIIHLHNIHGYYLNYPELFKYLSENNIPVVWTLHDCWPVTGHCSYFSDINCGKWKTECHHCPKKRSYPASMYLDKSRINYRLKKHYFNAVDNLTIITVSTWLSSIVKESYLAEHPVCVINNGIDLDVFYPQSDNSGIRNKYRIFDKYLLLGVASTWDRRKGLEDYLKLRGILSDEYVIVLVGLSGKQIKSLPPDIIGIKRTESIKELAELYSAADIVLNLSILESFGLTTVEGFACGTPGIVYNCTASPELVTQETGIIVEPGNIRALATGVEKIISEGKKHYAANCRKRALMYYNKEDRLGEYMKLYTELLNR